MNFQNLESFLVLAEEGSVTRAAERLHVSQQALSGLLARLEKEAGSPLFFRRSGLELTYAGICLQRAAIQILDIQRQTIAAMQDIRESRRARFASVFRIRADSPSCPCCFRRSANSIPWSS